MLPGFDMSLPASPPTPQQHSSNGFTHIASIPAMQPIKTEEPSPPLGGYNNGMQVATGVPSIFDPLPATSLATTVMQNQVVKKEEKQVLPIAMQPTANKPVGDGKSVSMHLYPVVICVLESPKLGRCVLTWPYLIKPIEYSPNHSVLCHVKTL
jgi:hypothetical protein